MTRTIVVAAAFALAVTLPIAPAQAAGAPRTFVSAAGSDSNNCTNVATPCRHFAAAFAATAADGEIYVLDPANYGSLTITHGVSIEGHGWASIAPVFNGNAITINANPGDKINIIGVVLDGTATANTSGIVFFSGASLTIQDSVIRNVAGDGINFAPTSSSSISVSNSFVGNNGGYGILVQPQGLASATAVFDRVRTQYNGANAYGISLDSSATTGTVSGTATDSVSSNNGGGYIAQGSGVGHTASLTLVRSVAANNHTGVQGGAFFGFEDAVVLISKTAITKNVLGCNNVTETYGDNIVNGNGNGSDGGCSVNPIAKQ
jgi:hypothetical protein